MYSEVVDEWKAQAQEAGQTVQEYYTRLACEIMQEAGREDFLESFTYIPDSYSGEKKIPVSGYSYDQESRELTLIVTHFDVPEARQTSPKTLNKARTEGSFKEMRAFYNGIQNGQFDELVPGSALSSLVDLIRHGDMEGIRPSIIRMLLVSNSYIKKEYIPQNFLLARNGDAICCEWMDFSHIQNYSATPPSINFAEDGKSGLSYLKVKTNDNVDFFDAYLLVIPGTALAKAYARYKDSLLEKNVRGYLHKTKTNDGIVRTIRKEPDLCFLYNNGLTLTATELVFAEDGSIVELKGTQIVNGGQTTATIHKEWVEDPKRVERVFVQAKLTVVPEAYAEGLVREIAIYSNSQNAVKDVDLRSSDHIQRALEYYSRNTPNSNGVYWYYERVTKQYMTHKQLLKGKKTDERAFLSRYPRKLDAKKMATAVMAFEGNPMLVAQGVTKIMNSIGGFSAIMNRLLDENPDYKRKHNQLYKDCVAKYILYEIKLSPYYQRFIASKYPANTEQSRNILAYAVHAFVTCLTAKGKSLNFKMIWDNQDVSEQLINSFMSVGEEMAELTKDRPRTWFRAKDSWPQVEKLIKQKYIWLHLDTDFPEVQDGAFVRYSDMLIKSDKAADEKIQRIRMASATEYFKSLKAATDSCNLEIITKIRGGRKLIDARLESAEKLTDAQCEKLYRLAEELEHSEFAKRNDLMEKLPFSIIPEKMRRKWEEVEADSVSLFAAAQNNSVYVAFVPCQSLASNEQIRRICEYYPELCIALADIVPEVGTIKVAPLNDGRKVILMYYAATSESLPYHRIFEACFKSLAREIPYTGEDFAMQTLYIECSNLLKKWPDYLNLLPKSLSEEMDYVQAKWIYMTEMSES